MSDKPCGETPTFDGLVLGLRNLYNREGDEGFYLLAAVSSISYRKIKAIMDESYLPDSVERAQLEMLM